MENRSARNGSEIFSNLWKKEASWTQICREIQLEEGMYFKDRCSWGEHSVQSQEVTGARQPGIRVFSSECMEEFPRWLRW